MTHSADRVMHVLHIPRGWVKAAEYVNKKGLAEFVVGIEYYQPGNYTTVAFIFNRHVLDTMLQNDFFGR
jgi:hypothetical protein